IDRSRLGCAPVDVLDHRPAADVRERLAGQASRVIAGGDEGDSETGSAMSGLPGVKNRGHGKYYHTCTRVPRDRSRIRDAVARRVTRGTRWGRSRSAQRETARTAGHEIGELDRVAADRGDAVAATERAADSEHEELVRISGDHRGADG